VGEKISESVHQENEFHFIRRMKVMSNQKRTRGRPRGSGKDDSRHLAKVADLLWKNPGLKATAAMTRVMKSCQNWDAASEDALIRRWQAKWRIYQHTLLAEAQYRATMPPSPVAQIQAFLNSDPNDLPIFKAISDFQVLWQRLSCSLGLKRVEQGERTSP
jgi:hypothetical protein